MTNVINTLKLVAPEFGTMSDDDIQSWVSLAEPFVSKRYLVSSTHRLLPILQRT